HYSLYILFFITFFFNDPSPPELYTLSLHDALPIFVRSVAQSPLSRRPASRQPESGDSSFRAALTLTAWTDFHRTGIAWLAATLRSEEHTSELQSPYDLVCRLLLEKKKKNRNTPTNSKSQDQNKCQEDHDDSNSYNSQLDEPRCL